MAENDVADGESLSITAAISPVYAPTLSRSYFERRGEDLNQARLWKLAQRGKRRQDDNVHPLMSPARF